MIDNCLDDWRIAMTWQRVLQIGAEVTSKYLIFNIRIFDFVCF